ncbi:hypothetical protein [Acinetobacter phage ABPH49]|nr:hypothetical protein [Acinetobacter phage ABPH49]
MITLQELLDISKEPVVLTDEDKKRIRERFKGLEEEFEKQRLSHVPTAEMLNRLYTL